MYKIFILFSGFFLLASCNITTQNPTPETKIEKQEIITEITPITHIQVENPDEVKGIQFSLESNIRKNAPLSTIVSNFNEENEKFLRSHKEKILENFPEFQNNPTTGYSTENILVNTQAKYNILNDIYFGTTGEKMPNPTNNRLNLGIIQNYNKNYTDSLWDLPLASLYCRECQTVGIPTDAIILSEKSRDIPDGFLLAQKEENGQDGFLSISKVTLNDNSYSQVPDKIIYDIGAIADIYNFFKKHPNLENSFEIKISLPETHEISDIIYENGNENFSLKNIFSENSLELTKMPKIIENATGKITIFISQK